MLLYPSGIIEYMPHVILVLSIWERITMGLDENTW